MIFIFILVYNDDNVVALKVLDYISSPTLYFKISSKASNTWQSKRLYCEDIMDSCSRLLSI